MYDQSDKMKTIEGLYQDSIQRCNIHRHKQDIRWNSLIACEFVDEFCCVFDVAWNKLHQALENGIDET